MRAIIALILMVGTANAAPLSQGWWYSDELEVRLTIRWPDFELQDYGVVEPLKCKFTSWPLSSPIAEGECEDGSKHQIEMDTDKVTLDGYPMTQTFEAPD